MICRNDFVQGDMLVPIAGVGVLFRHSKPDHLLRAGMNAGKTGLTAAGRVNGLSACYTNGAGGAHLFADSAADAGIADLDKMLKYIRRHLTNTA